MVAPAVGVLALQGDVREHVAALEEIGARARTVRRPDELEGLDALVMPGGESTAIARLLVTSGLRHPLAELLDEGLPVLGTCAGLILLASEILDGRPDQWSFGRLPVAVRRNGYGRQIASFEAPLEVTGVGPVTGVFIRAPRIVHVDDAVEVLATLSREGEDAHPVLVRRGPVWGASFHPELTPERAIHRAFLAATVLR